MNDLIEHLTIALQQAGAIVPQRLIGMMDLFDAKFWIDGKVNQQAVVEAVKIAKRQDPAYFRDPEIQDPNQVSSEPTTLSSSEPTQDAVHEVIR